MRSVKALRLAGRLRPISSTWPRRSIVTVVCSLIARLPSVRAAPERRILGLAFGAMSSTSETAAAGTFEQATAVERIGEGRYRAIVDPGWSTPIAANGGYLAAILVRAIEAHGATGTDRQLRSL